MDPQEMIARYGVWIFVLFNIAIGAVLGLVPLSIGFIKKRVKYGVFGFLACLIGGAILGIFLSLPACIFFTWFVVKQAKNPSPGDVN